MPQCWGFCAPEAHPFREERPSWRAQADAAAADSASPGLSQHLCRATSALVHASAAGALRGAFSLRSSVLFNELTRSKDLKSFTRSPQVHTQRLYCSIPCHPSPATPHREMTRKAQRDSITPAIVGCGSLRGHPPPPADRAPSPACPAAGGPAAGLARSQGRPGNRLQMRDPSPCPGTPAAHARCAGRFG